MNFYSTILIIILCCTGTEAAMSRPKAKSPTAPTAGAGSSLIKSSGSSSAFVAARPTTVVGFRPVTPPTRTASSAAAAGVTTSPQKPLSYAFFKGDVASLMPYSSPDALEYFKIAIIKLDNGEYVKAQITPVMHICGASENQPKLCLPEKFNDLNGDDKVFICLSAREGTSINYQQNSDGSSEIANLVIIPDEEYETRVFRIPSA